MTTESTERTPLLEEEKSSGIFSSVSGKLKSTVGGAVSTVGGAVSKVGGATMGAASTFGHVGADKLGSSYAKGLGFYDKLFWKDVNRAFGDHLEVASRGACFVVVCAIPFVMPGEICSWCDEIVHQGIYTSACVTYFIYTLYVYTGDILHFAQGGILGTLLAVFSIWLMQGFMPGGYSLDKPHRWWLGSLWGIVFTFLVLWLNFDGNTKIFCLSTYVWYWMVFIKPDATAGFSQNFEIKLDGTAVREFTIACIGCGIAVIAAYVPYPIYAHTKSMDVARKMLQQVYMTKRDFLTYYSGGKADPLVVRVLVREMNTLQNEKGTIAALLDSAQYERFGSSKWLKQQKMMRHFSDYIGKSLDLMSNAFEICKYETFDEQHVSVMKTIKEPLEAMVKGNGDILFQCVHALDNGSFDDKMKRICDENKQEVRNQLQVMSAALRDKRMSLGLQSVSDEISGENVVGLTFAKFAYQTAEFYDTLRKDQQDVKLTWKESVGIPSIFDPSVLFEKDHIMWVMRNAFSIILSFYAGWAGYNQYIAKYNAAIASTVAVLLSKFVGSAMVNNLARLQGVVIGIVLGNLLYAFLGWCYWWGHLLVALALYFWTLMGLFMYYHSTNYSTVGLLLVVFGCSSLLRPCANSDSDPAGHSAIVNVTVAISIMTIVDLLLSPARASDMALTAFQDAHTHVKKALETLFDPTVGNIQPRRVEGVAGDSLSNDINSASSMGNEAALEPRYWRSDWPTSKFDRAISCLKVLRFCIDSIESIFLVGVNAHEGRPKRGLFMKVLDLDSFKKQKESVLEHMGKVMIAVEQSIGNNGSPGVFEQRLKAVKNQDAHKNYMKFGSDQLDEFMRDLTKLAIADASSNPANNDMSVDPLADLCLLVESLKAMFASLDATLETLVS